jgi:hypothetical protein
MPAREQEEHPLAEEKKTKSDRYIMIILVDGWRKPQIIKANSKERASNNNR